MCNNSCGDPLTITGPVVGADPVCSGTKTYTWTYTDCTGASCHGCIHIRLLAPTFTLPAAGSSTVPCISDAQVVPTPPVVNNSCGDPLTLTGPVVGADPVCCGPKTYTWTYTDCTGTSGQWVYTYTVAPSTFILPANGGSTVACISDAQVVPTPPVVDNSCGDPVIPTGPVVGADPVCSGTKTYTWTYTDCSGNAMPWVYTYTITPPTFTLPAAGGSTVACISDAQVVPTPPVVNNSCGRPTDDYRSGRRSRSGMFRHQRPTHGPTRIAQEHPTMGIYLYHHSTNIYLASSRWLNSSLYH